MRANWNESRRFRIGGTPLLGSAVNWHRMLSSVATVACLVILLGAATAQAAPGLVPPVWQDIFGADGSVLDVRGASGSLGANGVPDHADLYGGRHAEFITENLSGGLATDMSALLTDRGLDTDVVFRGEVRAVHDLGHAYLLVTGARGGTQLFAAVEHAAGSGTSFVDVEFNQGRVRLSKGSPWPIHGSRTLGDVRVRLSLVDGEVQGASASLWDGTRWGQGSTLGASARPGCFQGSGVIACSGAVPFAHPEEGFETWDENFTRVELQAAESLLEVGVDVRTLTGGDLGFRSVQFRTPEDVALTTFPVTH